MRRPTILTAALMIAALGLLGRPAGAVITRLTPLREVLSVEQLIFVAEVEAVDANKPAAVLQVKEDLKGTTTFHRMPVNLTGDSEAKKEKHTEMLLKRLAPKLPLVVFASKRGPRYTAFAYTSGTWFQMLGQVSNDEPPRVTWSFTHGEPYLRRTFKGSTTELRQVVLDGLAGKKAPPEPDPKEPPGFGPEVKKDAAAAGPVTHGVILMSIAPSSFTPAVIPTFVLVGPLAVLAALFPAIFGGLAMSMRRWLVLLSIASLDSTLYFLHTWFHGRLKDSWWGTPTALWLTMAVVTLAGVGWSLRRWRWRRQTADYMPRRFEIVVLSLLSLLGVGMVLYPALQGKLLTPPWRELLPFWTVSWAGCLCVVAIRRGGLVPAEGIMLGTLAVSLGGLAFLGQPRALPAGERFAVQWKFEASDRGLIASSPLVTADRVFIAGAHSSGFTQYGALYCLDRVTGQVMWTFTDDGGMKQVFSTPCLADGRLYIGEGFHQDKDCKFYCLDAATGKKLWEFQTTSHTESSPCVAGGRVFFGAGDDGVFCLDAVTGAEIWKAPGWHVDTPPAISGKRLYAGSGYGSTEVFCLDGDSGKPIWRMPVDLPAFAGPVVADGQVFFAIGNGDFVKSAAQPAGALLCLDAMTGQRLWRYDVADGAHGRPVLDGERVYFGARDGRVYAVDRREGRPCWQADLGSPVVASPALVGDSVYVAASGGRLACLDRTSGDVRWRFDVPAAQLLSSPAVAEASSRRLYFGAGVDNVVASAAVLYALEATNDP